MTTPNLIDPFHRGIYSILSQEIDRRIVELANGSATAIQGASETVAEKYAAQVAYIRALSDVLAKCKELELELYGAGPKTEGQE